MNFNEYKKLRDAGYSQQEIERATQPASNSGGQQISNGGRNNSGSAVSGVSQAASSDNLSFADYKKLRDSGYSQQEIENADLSTLRRSTPMETVIAGSQARREASELARQLTSSGYGYRRQKTEVPTTPATVENEEVPAADNRTKSQRIVDTILGADRTQVTGEKTDWGKTLKGAWLKGWNESDYQIASGMDFLFGGLAEEIHTLGVTAINDAIDTINLFKKSDKQLDYVDNKGNFITRWKNKMKQNKEINEQYFAENATTSRAAQIVDKFGTETVAAVPMAIEAVLMTLMTGGGYAAEQATTAGLTYFSGLQSAQGAEAVGMMAKEGLTKLVQNPQFWSSYVDVVGTGYEDALEDGMGETDAAIYAMVNGYFNAMVEVGGADEALGGIQNLPMRLKETGGKNALVEWFKDAVLGEGKEEVIQGLFERGLKQSMQGDSISEMVSFDPSNTSAAVNPWTAGQEFLGGAAVGAILGGGQTGIQTAINAGVNGINQQRVKNYTIDQTAKALNATKEEVTQLMKDYKLEDPSDVAMLAVLYDTDSVDSFRENVKDAETAGKVISEVKTEIKTQQEASTSANKYLNGQSNTEETKSAIQSAFKSSNINLTESESDVLTSGYESAETDPGTYLYGAMEAYKLGRRGDLTLEEAIRVSNYAGRMTETQFRNAFELGSMQATTKTNTVNLQTEEGKNRLSSALASLGKYSDQAAQAYKLGQDVSTYAAAMEKAAVLYAANGIDLETVVQQARSGKTSDIVGKLTNEQIAVAKKIGQQIRAENASLVRQMSAKYTAIREKAAAITAGNAQALSNIDTAIKEANEFGKKALAAFNSQLAELESMAKDNPDIQNSEEYAKLYDEAAENKQTALEMQKAIQELQAKKKEIESKKPANKKGSVTVAKEGGSVQGMKYDAVDESKLTSQQKTVMEAARTIADVTGLDIVVVEGKGTFGGAYVGGGKIYLNIKSGMDLNTFNKVIAAASLSHEMTHWLKETAPEEYEALRQIVINSMSAEQFDRLVQEQLRTQPNLSYDEAVDEVVCNACQPMLQNSQAIQQIARENMSLAEKIVEFIHDFVEKIKAAFAEIDFHDNIPIYHAVQAVENQLDSIQQAWDAALLAARENMNAQQAVGEKNTAETGGVEFQIIKNVEDVNGTKYANVVQLEYSTFKKVSRSGQAFINFIRNNLINQTITVYNANGSETVVFARQNERVKKDGAKNAHPVLGELERAKNPLKKLVIVNAAETAEISKFSSHSDENSHQWLDANGWDKRTSYVLTKDGKIYPVELHIAKARDGRNILYDINVKLGEGVDIATKATSGGNSSRRANSQSPSSGGIVPNSGNGVKGSLQTWDEITDPKQQGHIGSIDLHEFADAKDSDGNALFQVFAFEHDEPEYRAMLKQAGNMSDAEIDRLFATIDFAVGTIKSNLEALDYAWEADINDRGFSPVKPNSDKLYKVSQDFSTLCRKRILQGAVANQLQLALDRALTREEGIAIRDALMAIQAEGKQIEVACALCYVESARMRSPKQIQRFLDNKEKVLKDFFAGQDRVAMKQKIDQAELDERQKIYEEGIATNGLDVRDPKAAPLKKLPGKVADRIRDAKKAVKATYAVTAEQQKIIDAANSMSVADFTDPARLENLAKYHREIFDAYTSFIRNATNSKGIENDTWWRSGDSVKISDLLIEQMNRENGLRTQSWSDFQVKHLMDYIAATIELSTRGAKQHAYTKVIDYVDLMGDTGVMINMSLIPTREYSGKLEYDNVEGFVAKEAKRLREKYHKTAGTICIGVHNDQIQKLLASDFIDYVIPYHRSGMAAHTRAAMHIPLWDDYQDFQSEKKLSGKAAQENAARFGAELLDESDPNWHEAPSFSDWFDLKRARQLAKKGGKTGKYGVMTGGYAAMQDAARNYMRICAERGLAPKFSYGRADFSGEANYWKLLIDRKMVDNVTGDIIEQEKIQPRFNMDTIERILNDELDRYGKVKEDQNEATRRVTEAFLSGKIKGGMSSQAIAEAMQKTVDNISITNITQNYEQVQSVAQEASEAAAEDNAPAVAESMNKLQLWTDDLPQKTQYGFKLMRVDAEGKPHAMFIDAATPYELGQWYAADAPGLNELLEMEPGYAYLVDENNNIDIESRIPVKRKDGNITGLPNKAAINKATEEGKRWMTVTLDAKGKKAVANVGIGGGKDPKPATFAMRPGLHAVDIPSMAHIGPEYVDENGETKKKRRTDERWFLIEYPVDVDYNQEAFANPDKDIKDHLPTKGWYSFQTNKGSEKRQHWFITGGMKIVGAVSESDVRKYARDRGFEEDLQWLDGKTYTEDDAIDLDEYMRTTTAQPTPSKREMARRIAAGRNTEAKTGKPAHLQAWIEEAPDRQHNVWAPTFYSKMQNTIESWTGGNGQVLPAKMSAGSVISWLKGKGVKNEEIKWSGLVQYLEGKKSVTKEELLQVMAENQIQIETKTLEGTQGLTFKYNGYTYGVDSLDEAMEEARTFLEERGMDPDLLTVEPNVWEDGWVLGTAETGEELFEVVQDSSMEPGKTRWSEYRTEGGKNYREILFTLPGSDYKNNAMKVHWGESGVMAHARVQDYETSNGGRMLLIEEIQSDWHNAGASSKFTTKEEETRLQAAKKKIDDMRDEWRRMSVKAADIADGITGRLNGYVDNDMWAAIDGWIKGQRADPSKYKSGSEKAARDVTNVQKVLTAEDRTEIDKVRQFYTEYYKARDEYRALTGSNSEEFTRPAPDVPFAGSSDTYHEYVMKHLLRLAAEGDYNYIGWTTAQQQSDRWSEDFAEGYRIEYDQNIPKFMRKYVRQWGSSVGMVPIAHSNGFGNAVQVWGSQITESMKQDVLYEGQPLFQTWKESADQISLNEWMNGANESSSLHPKIKARLDAAADTEKKVKDFFRTVDEDSELWLSDDEIDDLMDYDVYGNTMSSADEIVQILSDMTEQKTKGKTKIYELMEALVPYMSISSQDVWIYQENSRDPAFASWYSRRHPSLYYPGYKAGDLSSGHIRGENKANVAREITYLKKLLAGTRLSEEERTEAQDMLNGLQEGKIYYQKWDEIYDDTSSESEGRELSFARLRSENKILSDTVKSLKKLTEKKDTTIGKLQQQLHLTKEQQVRESDAKKLARELAKEYGSRVNTGEIATQLKELGDYILQTPVSQLSEETLRNKAREIAVQILNESVDLVESDNETYRTIAEDIKGMKLSIDRSYAGEFDSYGGFEAFRKSMFGSATFSMRETNKSESRSGYSSVDQFYEDMQSRYGEGFFPDIGNEGERAQVLAELIQAAKPIEVNPFERYMGEATEDMANRIVMDAMSGVLRPTAPTFADQQKARRVALQEQIKELKAENAMDQREAAKLYQTIYDLSTDLDRAESRYETLRQEAAYREAQVREEGAARAAEAYALARERTSKRMKDYYHQLMEDQKSRREESSGVSKYRKQIEVKAEKLREMLVKNTDKQHIPEVLKKPVAEFLSSLDFSSKRLLKGGEETQNDKKFASNLLQIQQILSNQQDYINGNGEVQSDLGGYIDVSPESMEFLRNTAELITKALSVDRTFTINQMTASQLKDLSNFLSSLNAGIRNMNYFMANARYESVQEAASGDVDFMKELGKAGPNADNATINLFVWKNGIPYYIFKRYGKGGQSIFEGFTKGWEKMAFNAQEIIAFAEDTFTDNEVRAWKQKQRRITLENGSQIVMTDAQIMEFAMLLKREQALKHIEKGGVRIGKIEMEFKKINDVEHYHFTAGDIANITGLLSSRQMEVANKLQQYMAKKGSQWGNEVSMRRFGYEFYTEGENYFPIKTDSNDRPMADTDAQMNSMFRLLNLSSSKALNPKASNALVVNDIFDTFADHMSDMAKLNGMGLPVLDAIKWFNYKERIDNPDGTYTTRTLQGAMERAYGAQAQHYFRTLMKDINGVTEGGDRGAAGFAGLMGNFKAAAVGANLRVALLQPTSYVRSLTVIKPQYLALAFTRRNAYKEAMKYSGTAVWKSLGYYDTDIAKSMRGQIEHADNIKDKIVEASMKGAELGDKLTWGRLWVACKLQVKAENGTLTGNALMEATAALFREAIYSSQVMDSTLTRSEWMRSKSNFDKMFTPFMAEPTLSYNILMNAASNLTLDERRYGKAEAWKRNAGKIGRAYAVYLVSAAANALAESVWDAVRDDDDYETFWEKFLQALFGEKSLLEGNLLQDILISNKIPLFKDVISMLSGYNSSNIATDGIRNLWNATQIWWESWQLANGQLEKATKITYYGKMTEWGKTYKTLQALSQLSGYPASSFTRDVIAIWNTMMNGRKDEWKIKTYDGSSLSEKNESGYEDYVKSTGITKNKFKKMLDDADVDGGTNPTQDEFGTYLEKELAAGNITEEQAQALWTSRWHSEKSKTFDQWRGKKSENSKQVVEKSATGKNTAAVTKAVPAKVPNALLFSDTSLSGSASLESSGSSIEDYDDFKSSNVPIYRENIESAYTLWEKNVAPLGIDLDEYVDIVTEANSDGENTATQDEMGRYLLGRINDGTLTYEQASAIWGSIWSKAKSKTFDRWVQKNG